MKMEKIKTNANIAGIRDTPESMPQNVLHDSISPNVFNVFGSVDSELQKLAEEPLFKMYAEVGPEIYEMISRTNPVLKAVIDLAKEICEGGQ